MATPPADDKSWFQKGKDKLKSGFNTASESSTGRAFIGALKNIVGWDLGHKDGQNSDGTDVGKKKGKGKDKKQVAKKAQPDQTQQRAKFKDEPFTLLNPKADKSRYYNHVVESFGYTNKTENHKKKGELITVGPRPYSTFNKYSLVNYRGTPLDGTGLNADGASISAKKNGKPQAYTGVYHKINVKTLDNPTTTRIVQATSAIENNFGYRYNYADFALAKYHNKIPNNYLITLRRFISPAKDDIITPCEFDKSGELKPLGEPDIARAVTWLGEATGNKLADIVKFSNGFGWKDAESTVQTINIPKRENTGGKFGDFVNSNRFARAAALASSGTSYAQDYANSNPSGYDHFGDTYPNHVYGPLNVIKNVLVREQGLTFNQEFKITFEYELRHFEGANPKLMFLDLLSNILALTYNNAPFWGGATRYTGGGSAGPAKPLGDFDALANGDYLAFGNSLIKGIGDLFKGAGAGFGELFTTGSFEGLKNNKFLNNLIGGFAMETFNTPQGAQSAAALLSGAPTGQWHLTIGNPFDPIMVIGNLCMTNCEVNFDGPLGIQDFPEQLKVTITLKPGRPRDKGEIESMFNAGRGRFYVQPSDVADINKSVEAREYGEQGKGAGKSPFVNAFRKMSNN